MRKRAYTIQIKDPCSEDWSKMSETERGRFCQKCSKNVIDFTSSSDQQILKTIKNGNDQVCGRFRNDQLNNTITYQPIKNKSYKFRAMISMFLLGFSTNILKTQTNKTEQVQTINNSEEKENLNKNESDFLLEGIVLDAESNQPIIGAGVRISGTSLGVKTDKNGLFRIKSDGKLAGLYVSINTPGYFHYHKEIQKSDLGHSIEIKLTNDPNKQVEIVAIRQSVGKVICEPVVEEKKWWQFWK